jgi:hypothetical protein
MPRRRLSRRTATKFATLFSRVGAAVIRRSPVTDAANITADAALDRQPYILEQLEERLLFTVIGAPGTDTIFEYLDAKKTSVRVALHDMTVQLIGVVVPMDDTPVEAELTPDFVNPPPTDTANLFTIYVIQSNLDSWMSVADVPSITTPGPRPMDPFNAPVSIRVNNAGIGLPIISAPLPATSGGVLLGAQFIGMFDNNITVLSVPNTGAASGPYAPADPATLFPGVYMAPTQVDPITGLPIINSATGLQIPNDLGRFFFGGTITGNVNIPAPIPGTVPAAPASQGGNVGVFYAGNILTGDASGVFQVAATPSANQTPNFFIGGDIRDLVTDGDIGGDPVGARLDMSHYFTGFAAQIAGTVGQLNSREGNLMGTFDVEHLPSIYGLPNTLFTQLELEAKNQGNTSNPGNLFQGAGINGVPELGQPFNNDSTPFEQFLGSEKQIDAKSGLPRTDIDGKFIYVAQVNGNLEGSNPDNEQADNYGIPMMAGQTFTTTLTELGPDGTPLPGLGQELQIEVIDPEGRIVASDENKVAPQLTWDSPFSYTADKPGVYTFAIIMVPGGVDELFDTQYRLTVQGVGDMGLGAVAIPQGNIYDGGYDSAYEVDQGDMGAMVAGAVIASGTSGSGPVVNINNLPTAASMNVGNGNLRTVSAGSIGVPLGLPASNATTIPFLVVPHGSVGLLRATDPAGILAVQSEFTNYLVSTNPALPSNSVTASPLVQSAIGGDFQTINGSGAVLLAIACDRAIGNILAGNMATIVPSFIEVNADNTGEDGKIDLIDSTGDIGILGGGGPGIVTNSGGDVRYIECGGLIYRDAFFGSADQPDSVIHAPGQAVTFTDDSGTVMTLTPVGPVGPNPEFTPANVAVDPSIQPTEGPQLIITPYPIRGSGGAVLVDVAVANITAVDPADANPMEGGLTISASSTAADAVVEISRIQVEGNNTIAFTPSGATDLSGLPTVTDLPTGTTAATATGLPTLSLTITGNTEVDVLNVVVSQIVNPQLYVLPGSTIGGEAGNSLTPPLGNALLVSNDTPNGEIVRVLANSIGTLFSAGTLGVAKHSTPAAVLPIANITVGSSLVDDGSGTGGGRFSTSASQDVGGTPNITNTNETGDQTGVNVTYPFMLQKTGITAAQSIQNLWANEGLGNVNVVGSIQNVNPNLDGKAHPGFFSGIIGPVVAGPLGGTIAVQADLNNVNLGQGMISSGTGIFSASGLYGVRVGIVTGRNGDLRGQIESLLDTGSVSIHNGSIIDADIIAVNERIMHTFGNSGGGDTFQLTYTQGVQFFAGIANFGGFPTEIVEDPTIEIGSVSVTGNGGIIGTLIAANDISSINSAGFGIIESIIITAGTDQIQSVVGAGYGIRGTTIDAGSFIGVVAAVGGAANLSVASVSPSVRQSEILPIDANLGFQIDPSTGTVPNQLTDIDSYLGTSRETPIINGTTDTGVLEDDVITASTNLNNVFASKIRTAQPLISPATPQSATIPKPNQPFPMQINIADRIKTISVGNLIDGLSITTGQLSRFSLGGSVSRLGITVAGTIANLIIPGNFGNTIMDPATGLLIPDSYIQAVGAAGIITSLRINGNLHGNISADQAIVKMTVGGNIFGDITAKGQVKGLTLGILRIGGTLSNGSLNVLGNAGSIITNGGLGAIGDSLTIAGNLNSLTVGANRAFGHNLNSALHVMGSLNKLMVSGQVNGAITVDDNLNTMKLNAIGAVGNLVTAPITVGGRIGTAQVTDGNVAANVIANGSISSFTIVRASVESNAIIQSKVENIRNFRITGGAPFGMFGTLLATNGLDEKIDISGNVGDGTDAASITALSAITFHIHGSILSGTNILVGGPLGLLQVDGNITAGATIAAHPLVKLLVRGTNQGTIIAT